MKKLYITIIIIGIVAELILVIFFNKKIATYGPMIFWVIGLFAILKYGTNIFKLTDSVKRTKPELFKKYGFGIMITTNALSDKEFFGALDVHEQKIVENNKTIFKFLILCFGLFALSILLLVLI